MLAGRHRKAAKGGNFSRILANEEIPFLSTIWSTILNWILVVFHR
uniref:Vacuolar cation/proton exchanger n=1 Tax=Rhizophora mucronata TaxID=61149 RepID=A0A2P2LPK6_RHIMU